MGKKYWRANDVYLMGQKCILETWHTDDGWFHTKRHSKCIHVETGMVGEGFDRDCYAAAEAQAKNQCSHLIAAWLERKRQDAARAAEMKRLQDAARKAEEARQRAEAEARRRAEQLRQQQAAAEAARQRAEAESRRQAELLRQQQAQAEAERQRAEAESRRQAEQLRQQRAAAEAERQRAEAESRRQREAQRAELTRSRATLMAQLQEKRTAYDDAHRRLMAITTRILSEEKDIEEFKVERADGATKICIMLGMTGGGKSTLCNRLMGDESMFGNAQGGFATSGDGRSCTQSNAKKTVQIGQHRLTIVDTPGCNDSMGRDRQHSNRLCKYLKGCGGINAFVLVRNGANVRFDSKFQDMLRQYHGMFGDAFFSRLVIVATRIEGFTKMQYEHNHQENTLRADICDLFGLNFEIPVIAIGFEGYQASLAALADAIPADKHAFQQVHSPIDELRQSRSAITTEEANLNQQVQRIQGELNRVDTQLAALN